MVRENGRGGRGPTVVLLTAGMGGGHTGVAAELARRLEQRGARARLVDVWDLQPLGAGALMTRFYRFMILRLPWLYQLIYSVWLRPAPDRRRGPLSPVTRWAERRLLRLLAEDRPAVVVSTFHLGTQLLGHLRAEGRLAVPTVSVCVDFAAHGLWVHPGVDVNLCWDGDQARRLTEQGAKRATVVAPVVAPAFQDPPMRSGPTSEGTGNVLVVGGSWGAGRLERAVERLGRSARRATVICASNSRLRRRMRRRAGESVRILGWVDDVAPLMREADVVVENAGGLMAMEAMALHKPVVSFAPIPGHGRENVEAMAAAGLAVLPDSADELIAVLDELTEPKASSRRCRLQHHGDDLFAAPDAAEVIWGLAERIPIDLTGNG